MDVTKTNPGNLVLTTVWKTTVKNKKADVSSVSPSSDCSELKRQLFYSLRFFSFTSVYTDAASQLL